MQKIKITQLHSIADCVLDRSLILIWEIVLRVEIGKTSQSALMLGAWLTMSLYKCSPKTKK